MKTCSECGEKIAGREDKRFCSDGCRNNYNNKINKDSTSFMRNVNRLLRRNYRILNELNSQKESTASRIELVKKGFDFDHFTSIRKTKKGKILYFLYDHGYHNISGDSFRLVRERD